MSKQEGKVLSSTNTSSTRSDVMRIYTRMDLPELPLVHIQSSVTVESMCHSAAVLILMLEFCPVLALG